MTVFLGRKGRTGRPAETVLPFFCAACKSAAVDSAAWKHAAVRVRPGVPFAALPTAALVLVLAVCVPFQAAAQTSGEASGALPGASTSSAPGALSGASASSAPGASGYLPAIPRLDSRDTLFRQYVSDVEEARRALFASRQKPRAAGELASLLTVYSYVPAEGDGLMAVAARCNIPYGTLASINRFSHAEDMAAGRVILLPSMPGIFIPETPASDLERLIFSARLDDGSEGVLVSLPAGSGTTAGGTERFRFIPGEDFSPTERIFFFNHGFSFPLRHFRLTSSYGPRVNPVTGKAGVHGGLDLAAPEGSEVYAVKAGTVAGQGEDSVLGKYVIVNHDNNWVSFYGHLSAIRTEPRAEVLPGGLIGEVGTTGQSTGPHLHFELRQNGRTRDPARLLGLFKNQ